MLVLGLLLLLGGWKTGGAAAWATTAEAEARESMSPSQRRQTIAPYLWIITGALGLAGGATVLLSVMPVSLMQRMLHTRPPETHDSPSPGSGIHRF